jgi:SAM-dependent methyltransferase
LTSRVLHAGCGPTEPLPPLFQELFGDDIEEVRLDVDPDTKPDIVASILNLGDIGVFDCVYASHTIEHLYPHEVPIALREFRRVLADDGFALIFVPDLEGVTLSEEPLYLGPAGRISAMDLFYGYRPDLPTRPAMAHHTGFTSAILADALREAGFSQVYTQRAVRFAHNLMGVARR